jgi:hypothetical protein
LTLLLQPRKVQGTKNETFYSVFFVHGGKPLMGRNMGRILKKPWQNRGNSKQSVGCEERGR